MSASLFTPPPYNGWLNVVTKVTTYAVAIADDVVLCSGSAFTVTLPTAVGISGKQFKIKKTDASLANIITIATTSSQTIDGVTTTTLNTIGESALIVSDGSNWQIIDRRIPEVWTSYTPAGNGTNWTTNCVYSGLWLRDGANLRGQTTIAIGGAPGSASIDPILSLPTGSTIDYSNMTFTTGASTILAPVGQAITAYSSSSGFYNLIAYVVSGTNSIRVGGLGTISTHTGTVYVSASGPTTTTPGTYAAGGAIQVNFTVPISGWNG